jgi:hypothetical protein
MMEMEDCTFHPFHWTSPNCVIVVDNSHDYHVPLNLKKAHPTFLVFLLGCGIFISLHNSNVFEISNNGTLLPSVHVMNWNAVT